MRLPDWDWTRVGVYAGLFVGVLALFSPAAGHPFLNYDDGQYVVQNPHVSTGLSAANAVWALTATEQANWHPLTWLSLQLDAEVYGSGSAFGFHITNVVLHAVNTVLLAHLLAAMTGSVWRAAVAAALFAVHPLHVESVAWVAERKDVLSTLFWLLASWAYLRYVRRPSFGWYAATLVALALGLTAKAMLVTLPCSLLLLDYWPLARLSRRAVLEKLPMVAVVAASSAVTAWVQNRGGAVSTVELVPVETRLANALVTYVVYLRQTVWPTDLAPYYPHALEPLLGWRAAGAGLILAAVTAAAVRLRGRCPYLLVGWFWFLGTLVPVIGLVQVGGQSRADRYTYVPLIGVFVAAVWAAADGLARVKAPPVVRGLAAAAPVALAAVATHGQLSLWESNVTLWEHTVAVTASPNPVAEVNLGIALAEQEKLGQALPHLRAGYELGPDYGTGVAAYGVALSRLGRHAEALPVLERAARLVPGKGAVRYNLATELARAGRAEEALPHFAAAAPGNTPDERTAAAHVFVGRALLARRQFAAARGHFAEAARLDPTAQDPPFCVGLSLDLEGQSAAAVGHYEAALRLAPAHPGANTQLGLIRLLEGQPAAAVASCERAVAAKPDLPVYRANLALALTAAGRSAEARRQYDQASWLAPGWPRGAARSAWEVVTGDGTGSATHAVLWARQACEATDYRRPEWLVVLAAATAAAGQSAEAVGFLDRAEPAADLRLAERIRAYREVFRAGKSLRGRVEPFPNGARAQP